MRIIFFGSSSFSTQFLRSIDESDHDIIKVFTGSDKRTGRGKKIKPNPVKDYALQNSLDIHILDEFDDKSIDLLKNTVFDCAVVVSFGRLIPPELIEQDKTYINVHPSKLPKYRGPSPIESTLMNGEDETALSIIELSEEMDAGNILAQTIFAIDNKDNKDSLEKKHIIFGKTLILSVLKNIKENGLISLPQSESEATYTRMFEKHDYEIDWSENGIDISNKIKAFSKSPGAFTFSDGKRIIVLDAYLMIEDFDYDIPDAAPGTVVKANKSEGISIITGDGSLLKIESLKPQGKKEMSYKDFLNGYKIKEGMVLGRKS